MDQQVQRMTAEMLQKAKSSVRESANARIYECLATTDLMTGLTPQMKANVTKYEMDLAIARDTAIMMICEAIERVNAAEQREGEDTQNRLHQQLDIKQHLGFKP